MVGSTDGRNRPTDPAWVADHRELSGRPDAELSASELERLAVASYLIGEDDRCARAWEAARRRHAQQGDRAEAALCSFWLAFCLMMRGQMSQAAAWLGRTEATIAGGDPCPASGYLLIPALLRTLDGGDPATARELAAEAAAIAEQFADRDLAAFASLGDGQALVASGEVEAGIARFDEAMLSVTTGEVGPIVTGVVYCAVILECIRVFDIARAAEWTGALAAWCDAQPGLVPYRGQCLVHRSQLEQAAGDWSTATRSAAAACGQLADPPHPALGLARYQEAELHRVRGAFDEAAAAYAQATAHGHEPMPGLALLQLAQGEVEAASAAIGRALHEAGPRERPRLLVAAVEIWREARDHDGARRAALELRGIAEASPWSEVLAAMADQADGTVLLGEGDPAGALIHLRSARAAWTRLNMPHEAARTSVLVGLGCLVLGDRTSAAMELAGSRSTFDALGARPDAERVHQLQTSAGVTDPPVAALPSQLSPREREVLVHVAAGETNREIAAALTISRHTVGRHLENIFAKLGVKGRTEATAHAYEHHLL